MKRERETDVIVVGAGPVGLVTALTLAESGIRVLCLDKDRRLTTHGYALALHPDSQELLEQLGLHQELGRRAQRVERIGLYNGKRRVGEFDYTRLQLHFPHVLIVPQSALEQALKRKLREMQVKMLWNHALVDLVQHGSKVTAEVGRLEHVSTSPDAEARWVLGKTSKIQARYLIGADGFDSRVRRSLRAEHAKIGETECYAAFEFPRAARLGDAAIVFHRDAANVLWPVAPKRSRWVFRVPRAEKGPPDLERLHGLLRARAPWFEPLPSELHWSTYAWFERRLADPPGKGRVWLAGDAAHVTGPVGVQSMNIGLLEGRELGHHVAQALGGGTGGAAALEAWMRGRLEQWRRLLGIDGRLECDAGAPAWVRRHGPQLVSCVPAQGRAFDLLLEQVGLRFR